jgi:hypothetical protein
LGTILGHVMVHEIGHLLLGTNSHSASGIMRAQWRNAELLSAGKGALVFAPAQSRRMRQRLAAVVAFSLSSNRSVKGR